MFIKIMNKASIMKNLLVSAVIPAYNEEEHVKECIETLLEQSYKPFEIIFVDDGSIDNTVNIIKNYDVILFQQAHKGPGEARNFGVSKCRGEIVVFVDADMRFDKDYIKNLVKPILEKKSIGTNHEEELVSNKENIWARCWGRRLTTFKGDFAIFRAIRKDKFLEAGGFDPKKGYADDQTIYEKLKIRPILAEKAMCYHNNPNTLKDVFLQGKWIGASYKNKFLNIYSLGIFFISGLSLLVPFKIALNTFKKSFEERYLSYLFYYPVFGIFRYYGFIYGIIMNKYFKRNVK